MKIGIFDSGLGGVLIARAIRERLPDYSYVYFGDTLHVPYGKRSAETIYRYTLAAVRWLFERDCHLVVLACNTASAAALRRIQQEWLPAHYPDRRVLGVVVPMIEEVTLRDCRKIGLIGTDYLVHSRIYDEELTKVAPFVELYHKATPLLVPLIEHEGMKWIEPVLADYMQPLLDARIEALMLGCTHYVCLKPFLRRILPDDVAVLSQDDIVPLKFADYLNRHPERETLLDKGGTMEFFLTEITESYADTLENLAGVRERPVMARLV